MQFLKLYFMKEYLKNLFSKRSLLEFTGVSLALFTAAMAYIYFKSNLTITEYFNAALNERKEILDILFLSSQMGALYIFSKETIRVSLINVRLLKK